MKNFTNEFQRVHATPYLLTEDLFGFGSSSDPYSLPQNARLRECLGLLSASVIKNETLQAEPNFFLVHETANQSKHSDPLSVEWTKVSSLVHQAYDQVSPHKEMFRDLFIPNTHHLSWRDLAINEIQPFKDPAFKSEWSDGFDECFSEPISPVLLWTNCNLERLDASASASVGRSVPAETSSTYDYHLSRYQYLIDREMIGTLNSSEQEELESLTTKLDSIETTSAQERNYGSTMTWHIECLERILVMNASLMEMIEHAQIREAPDSAAL